MSPVFWIALLGAIAVLAGGGIVLAGRAERRQLAGRIELVQPPLPAPVQLRNIQITVRLPRLVLLDQLLGLDRNSASDAMVKLLPCLIVGMIGGGALFTVSHLLLTIGQPISLAAAAGAALLGARLAAAKQRTKVLDRMEDELSQALGVIIRCVRVGLPVVEAMRAVSVEIPAPTGPEFRRCVDQIQLGETFDQALVNLARRCVLPAYRFFAVSVSLQRQTGGNLSETLENLADTLRKRKALRLKVQALISEPMATVAVLSVLPFGVGGILMLIRPDYVMTLFTTDSGRMILGIAIVTQCIGLLVIRTMIKKTLS